MDQIETIGTNKEHLRDTAAKAHIGIDSVADKTAVGVDSARAASHQAIDEVAAGAERTADWATDNIAEVKQKQAEITQAAADMISARPFVAVGTAVAIGYLLGRIAR